MITRERMITSKVLAISEVPIRIAAAMEKRLFISRVPFLQSHGETDRNQPILQRKLLGQYQIDPPLGYTAQKSKDLPPQRRAKEKMGIVSFSLQGMKSKLRKPEQPGLELHPAAPSSQGFPRGCPPGSGPRVALTIPKPYQLFYR